MPYYLRGNLWGHICRECPRPLWGVILRVYEAEGERLIERAVADPKQTTAAVDEKDVKARAGKLLGEARVGEDGSYEIEFDKKSRYQGGPVDLEMRVESLDHLSERAPKAKPRQVHITTLQPAWLERGGRLVCYWEYYLHSRIWCLILSWFGLWVICGRVTVCETGAPVGSVRVHAWDADIWEDDPLGSAVTDATGRFLLYYTTADFAHSPWWNDELYHGPDLYFEVKSLSGQSLLAEPRSRARQPDRENVGTCFCVSLCLEDQAPVNEPLPAFIRVGVYDFTQINSVPGAGNGLTSADGRAFYHINRLNGFLSKKLSNLPMEYRFEFATTDDDGQNRGPWQPVTPAMVARTHIGDWQIWAPTSPTDPNPVKHKPYTVNGLGADMIAPWLNGWIQVPQESNTYGPEGFFSPNGNLINLISSSLASFADLNKAGLVAGSSSAPFAANKHFALRMMVRQQPASGGTGPAGGNLAGLLEHYAVNNTTYNNLVHHPSWAGYTSPPGTPGICLLEIQELIGNGCKKITNSLTPLVTAAHPTLGGVSMSLIGGNAATVGSGSVAAAFTMPTAGLPDERAGAATYNFNVNDLNPCAYILSLGVELLLTTGDGNPGNLVDQIAFAKA